MDDQVRAALVAGHRERLRLLLHPYLHRTEGGRSIRGRTRVPDHLAEHRVSAPPVS